MEDDALPAGRREKRQATKKASDRSSALQKLKEGRGRSLKDKYEVEEVENVYEEVDEDEYAETVRERAFRDFVVDDDGSGYRDDGREIFDAESDDEEEMGSRKMPRNSESKTAPKEKGGKTSDIRQLLRAAPLKKKITVGVDTLGVDAELLDIMSNVRHKPSGSEKVAPIPQTSRAKNPFTAQKRPSNEVRSHENERNVRPRLSKGTIPSDSLFASDAFDDEFEAMVKQEAPSPSSQTPDISSFDSQAVTESQTRIDEFTQDSKASLTRVKAENPEAMEDVVAEEPPKPLTERNQAKPVAHTNPEDTWAQILAQQESQILKDETSVKEEATDVAAEQGLPLSKDADGQEYLKFFWMDAHEEPMKQPGTVFLFGKVPLSPDNHVSCCVSVKNLERQVFFLPREKHLKTGEEVTCRSVYEELQSTVMPKHGISSFRVQEKDLSYAFDLADVPDASSYLVVRYPARFGELPVNLTGNTFSRVFAARTSIMENFIVQHRLKGPCWLRIYSPKQSAVPFTWCKLEASIDSYKHMKMSNDDAVLDAPPIVMLCVTVQTLVNPQTHRLEPLMIGMLSHTRYPLSTTDKKSTFQDHCCLITKPGSSIWPYDHQKVFGQFTKTTLKKMNSVRDMLSCFLAKMQVLDPDVVIGYDLTGCALDLLLEKMSEFKVPNWSRLGRLRRSFGPPKGGLFGHVERVMTGRIVCDVKTSVKELMRCRSYDLATVCSEVFPRMKSEDIPPAFSPDEIVKFYETSGKITNLVTWTILECARVLDLCSELSIIPLALQITKIAGNLLSRTLLGGRSERNEFLLLHAFAAKNYLVPDKEFGRRGRKGDDDQNDDDEIGKGKSKNARRKPAYKGGLVLEPKKGLHDNYVLLMDFKSLYPSIIQEYNICFTTIPRLFNAKTEAGAQEEEEEILPPVPDSSVSPGILSSEIRKLVETRQAVKRMLKAPNLSPELKQQYDVRQKALKLMANSMYGCLGFSHSRFYAPMLAKLITAKGREILEQTRDLVQNKMGLEVIYGDTDSIMINTNVRDMDMVMKLGNRIQNEVNKTYKLLELEVDNVFRAILLLKKKKYAAVNVAINADGSRSETVELKGLDIVRRDWSPIACEVGRLVVNQLLSTESLDEKLDQITTFLEKVGERIRTGDYELEELTVAKTLTRDPQLYPDKNAQPHVAVALRLNTAGGKQLKAGDTVKYVVCDDGTNASAMQRAYALSEMRSNPALKVDIEYYLAQQIHPVVFRLCEPIDGIDAARIAECLGLDSSKYHHMASAVGNSEREEMIMSVNRIDNERFRNCEKFSFSCSKQDCQASISIDGLLTNSGDAEEVSKDPTLSFQLLKCSREGCDGKPFVEVGRLSNLLTVAARSFISNYYEGWLKCDDPGCGERTRAVSLRFSRGNPVCKACNSGGLLREYGEAQLYNQLCYFQFMFHFEKATLGISSAAKARLMRILAENPELHATLTTLSDHMEKIIRSNAYSIVNLGELFAKAVPKKRESIAPA